MNISLNATVKKLLIFSFVVGFPLSASAEEKNRFKVVQKSTGKSITIKLLGLDETHLKVRLANGRVVKLKRSGLTQDSIERASALLVNETEQSEGLPKEKVTALNEVIGHKLFAEISLWEEKASVIAGRLKWPAEEKKENPASYRSYPALNYQFLGAHPYCATLYASRTNQLQRISLIFANKGDYGSTAGFGEEHFKKMHPAEQMPKTLEEAIDFDYKVVQASLKKAFGEEPVKQSYGEKGDRRTVLRWDLENQSFLLSRVKEEYVNLLIVPSSNADLKGRVKFVKDADLKVLLSKNLTHKENGDVYIDNIPMVNQGPKGYCAPATFERAMSYMKIPADMYLLATAATTEEGTNTDKLIKDCKRIIRSKARRIKEVEIGEKLKIRTVAKFIDRGVPILWRMKSLTLYNDIANKRTAERASVTDFKEWAETLQTEADSKTSMLEDIEANHHICMIIGYNKKTKEIAVSDSWGPNYALRWVHMDILKAVSSEGSFAIDL